MKNYDQREKFMAYLALGALGLAIFLVCYLAEHVGGRTFAKWILIASAIVVSSVYVWRLIYVNKEDKWIWWCSTCGKEVPAREVNEEEIHKSCGCEATYKMKK